MTGNRGVPVAVRDVRGKSTQDQNTRDQNIKDQEVVRSRAGPN